MAKKKKKKKKKKNGITTRRASNQCKTSDRGLLGGEEVFDERTTYVIL
jgi:hypothetical protein